MGGVRSLLVAGLAAALLAPGSAGAVTVRADLDGDRIYDDLERSLIVEGAANVIVVMDRRVPLSRVRAATGQFELRRRLPIINGFSAHLTAAQVRAVAALPFVRHVERVVQVRTFNDAAQEATGVAQARLELPGLDGDTDGDPLKYSAGDMVAAVVDTGIDARHRDLDGGKVIAFRDFVSGRPGAYDDEGHGTHVAATLAGDGTARADRQFRGVAPGAALVGVKVLDAAGTGANDAIIAGFQWVADNAAKYGIDVMNVSLGNSNCWASDNASALAIDAVADAGVLPVVAAGNFGPNPCTMGNTSAARKALTVANMWDPARNGWALEPGSSRGPTADGLVKPDIAAPGTEIMSADANTTSGYEKSSGTSMASPFVAGVALLMREAAPALDPAAVKQKLMATAQDWGRGPGSAPEIGPAVHGPTPYSFFALELGARWAGPAGSTGPDSDYGAGRIDAYRALLAAGAPLSTPPAGPAHRLLDGELSDVGDVDRFTVPVAGAGAPFAATLHIAEGVVYQNHVPGLHTVPLPPTVTIKDPAGAEVPHYWSERTLVAWDATPAPGSYTIEVTASPTQPPAQANRPLRYFIDVSHG